MESLGLWGRLGLKKAPSDGLLAGLLGAWLLVLDASLPTYFHNFDGVACAMAVDTGLWERLAHGNHVLYGLLGAAFHAFLGLFGYSGQALLSLGLLNRLLHTLCGVLFFLLLRRLGASARGALMGALCFSFSYGIWFYALEPQVYLLGLLGVLLFAWALLPSPRPLLAGLAQALAVGGHATHVLLAPAALYWLASLPGEAKDRRRALWTYGAALGLGTLAVYAVGAWATSPRSFEEWRLWLLGTAAIGEDRAFAWSGWGFRPWLWFQGLLLATWARPGGWGLPSAVGGDLYLQGAVLLVGLAAGFADAFARPSRRRLALTFALWLGAYLLFFSTWEPDNPNYHLADLVPFWILLTLSLESRQAVGRLVLALAMAGVLVLNTEQGIRPLGDKSRNKTLLEMEAVGAATPEDAWVGTLGGLGRVYVPYFAGRRPLAFRSEVSRPAVLDLKEPVYILGEVADDPAWGPRLRERFTLTPVPAPPAVLFRLHPK